MRRWSKSRSRGRSRTDGHCNSRKRVKNKTAVQLRRGSTSSCNWRRVRSRRLMSRRIRERQRRRRWGLPWRWNSDEGARRKRWGWGYKRGMYKRWRSYSRRNKGILIVQLEISRSMRRGRKWRWRRRKMREGMLSRRRWMRRSKARRQSCVRSSSKRLWLRRRFSIGNRLCLSWINK